MTVCVIRGAAFAITFVAGGALTVSLIPPQRRGEGLALVGVASGVPSVAALPLGVWLAGHPGYRLVFVVGGVAALVGLASVPWLPRSRPAAAGSRAAAATGASLPSCWDPECSWPSAGMLTLSLAAVPAAAMVGAALLGTGFGLAQNASLTLMYARVPEAGYSTVSAVWNLAYDGGMGLGAAGFGALAVRAGYPAAFAPTAAVLSAVLDLATPERGS
jgi:predicted MFS family arabinose efflux permease